MPELSDPVTRSPGHLIIIYEGYIPSMIHSSRVRFLSGAFPATNVEALALATDLAEAIAPVIRDDAYTAISWRVVNDLNLTIYEGGFAAPIVGTHADPVLDAPYLSQTISFGGRGIPTAPDLGAGQARVTLWTAGTYTFGTGDKRILFSDPSADAIADFGAFLAAHADLWADFYGQKASVRSYVNCQFNAGAQRTYGS